MSAIALDHTSAKQVLRILIVRAGALGDTLMVTPLIREFRERHPSAEIDFLCSAGGAELLASNPHLCRKFILRRRNLPYLISLEKQKLVRTIRSLRYGIVVLLEAAPRYRELLERAGIRDIKDFTSTPFDPTLHSIVNNLRAAGCWDAGTINCDMELPCSEDSAQLAAALLAGLPRPIIAIHPGYGPPNKKKEQANRLRGWSTANFARVAQQLSSRGASIVLTGSHNDLDLCCSIVRGLPEDRSRILAGKTNVAGLIAVIKGSDLLISVDSASAHLAAAVGTPVIVLWGPAILNQTKPVSSTTPIVILRKAVPCAPCYGTPLMKTCQRNICMEQITPEEVIQQAILALDKGRNIHVGSGQSEIGYDRHIQLHS